MVDQAPLETVLAWPALACVPDLLRDVLEVFSKEKINVTAVNTQSVKVAKGKGDTAWMSFTVEVADSSRLAHALRAVAQVNGVRAARRK